MPLEPDSKLFRVPKLRTTLGCMTRLQNIISQDKRWGGVITESGNLQRFDLAEDIVLTTERDQLCNALTESIFVAIGQKNHPLKSTIKEAALKYAKLKKLFNAASFSAWSGCQEIHEEAVRVVTKIKTCNQTNIQSTIVIAPAVYTIVIFIAKMLFGLEDWLDSLTIYITDSKQFERLPIAIDNFQHGKPLVWFTFQSAKEALIVPDGMLYDDDDGYEDSENDDSENDGFTISRFGPQIQHTNQSIDENDERLELVISHRMWLSPDRPNRRGFANVETEIYEMITREEWEVIFEPLILQMWDRAKRAQVTERFNKIITPNYAPVISSMYRDMIIGWERIGAATETSKYSEMFNKIPRNKESHKWAKRGKTFKNVWDPVHPMNNLIGVIDLIVNTSVDPDIKNILQILMSMMAELDRMTDMRLNSQKVTYERKADKMRTDLSKAQTKIQQLEQKVKTLTEQSAKLKRTSDQMDE